MKGLECAFFCRALALTSVEECTLLPVCIRLACADSVASRASNMRACVFSRSVSRPAVRSEEKVESTWGRGEGSDLREAAVCDP